MEKAWGIDGRRQLFVDGELVAEASSVVAEVQPARKHPANPLVVADRPWEGAAVYVYGTVVATETGDFRMWYQTLGPWENGRREMLICYAESDDGVRWRKPAVGWAVSPDEATNILHAAEIATVVYMPWEAAPRDHYRMMYFQPGPPAGYHALSSADGVEWMATAQEPVLRGYGDVGNLVWDPYEQQFLYFHKVHPVMARGRRRAVGLARSPDMRQWSLTELILAPDREDERSCGQRIGAVEGLLEFNDPAYHRCHFYGMGAMAYEGVFLGLLWVFDASAAHPGGNEDGPMEVQLVCSRDLKTWTRCGGREPIIPLGGEGEWDCGMIQTVSQPIVVGDEVWIYYGGWRVTHGHRWFWDRGAPEESNLASIGLAVVPRDRFVAVRADGRSGTLTTVPVVWTDGALHVNADCADGSLRVELVDPDGRVLEGYSAAEADPVVEDAMAKRLTWRGVDSGAVAGRAVQIRFRLEGGAKLYSFWVQ